MKRPTRYSILTLLSLLNSVSLSRNLALMTWAAPFWDAWMKWASAWMIWNVVLEIS